MEDKIILSGMKFYGYHGVLQEEQRLGQIFEVDLELTLSLKTAGEVDDPGLTVSYADVYNAVEEVVTGTPRKLLEAVAEDISQRVLGIFRPVEAVRVRVKKPGAPIKGSFGYMAVEIHRKRDNSL